MPLPEESKAAAATTTSSAIRKPTGKAWAEIGACDGRTFLYGPRLGRLYLLQPAQASDRKLLSIIGLPAASRQPEVTDPIERITHDRVSLGVEAAGGHRRRALSLKLAYGVFQLTRRAIPLGSMALIARAIAPLFRGRIIKTGATASDIGKLVHAVETGARNPNCYPRALLTALLAMAAGSNCTLLIGLLAPTRKMHAWCSVAHELPYEPSPEHYLYQPLWALTLRP